MKKILLYFVIILLLSGCSIKYNVKIDEKLNLTEELNLLEDNFVLEKINSDKYYLIDNLIDKYAELDDYSLIYMPRENIKMNIGKDLSGVISSIKLGNVENLNDSEILNKTVSGVEVEKKGSYYTIKIDNFFYNYMTGYFYDETKNMKIKEVSFSIESPFYVKESNADKVVKNKYIWNLTENNSNRKMYITFNKNKMVNEGILDVVLKYILLSIGAFILIGILYLSWKSKKNNAI